VDDRQLAFLGERNNIFDGILVANEVVHEAKVEKEHVSFSRLISRKHVTR